MDLFDRLSLALPRLRLLREEPLAAHTSFRIGGPAEVMAFPSSLAELQALLHLSAQEGIRVRLLGAGTNILAPDGGVRGLVIVTSGALTGLSMPDAVHIEAMSGVTMARLACFARDNGLTGLEFAHGIPGTVGGGVYMNAGAYGGEIRAVCLSKLALREDSVVWDVGAGTGSVTVEAAMAARRGRVYAVERKDAAFDILRENLRRFHTDNVTPVSGTAPDACADLPAPTHAFLGGTTGHMKEIIALLLEKNPRVRIVATAVTLESVAELTECVKAFPFRETEAVSLTAARSRKAGAYHLMTGQNPVYIFTMQG